MRHIHKGVLGEYWTLKLLKLENDDLMIGIAFCSLR